MNREYRIINIILDNAHDAIIYIGTDKKIKIYNETAARICKIPKEKALDSRIEDIVKNTRLPYVMETGRQEINQRQAIENIEIITSRVPIEFDGEIQGAVAIFRDVSEMVDLVEEITNLKELQKTLAAVFRATKDAISVMNNDGDYIILNPAYTRLSGYSEEEVKSKGFDKSLLVDSRVHKNVLSTGEAINDVMTRSRITKKDLMISASPVIVNREIKASVAVLHDITDVSKLGKELDKARSIIRSLEAKYTFDDIKGSSVLIKESIDRAKIAAATPATVILRGESGTGKELFAHAIHNSSNRKNAQFVRVNCASISESLLESELFGYEEGAFTGATKGGKLGYFERASGGTIFLDEIGEINLATQIKLLRVMQEKEIVRVGGTKPIPVDVRIISATNKDLEQAVKNGTFREDLYYRLNVIPIQIPPLRNRMEDLPELVSVIIDKFNQEYGRNVENVDEDVLEEIMMYDWPGNIRELENYIGRAVLHMSLNEKYLKKEHIDVINSPNNRQVLKFESKDDFVINNLSDMLDGYEKTYLENALKSHDGLRRDLAKKLGVSLRTLYYKLEKYGLN